MKDLIGNEKPVCPGCGHACVPEREGIPVADITYEQHCTNPLLDCEYKEKPFKVTFRHRVLYDTHRPVKEGDDATSDAS